MRPRVQLWLSLAACLLTLGPLAHGAEMNRPVSMQVVDAWARKAPMMPRWARWALPQAMGPST
jgi:hypothetical protein